MNLYDVSDPDLGYPGLIGRAKPRPCAEQRRKVGSSYCEMGAHFGCASPQAGSAKVHVCVRLCPRIIYRGSREAHSHKLGR